jgi:hypothetical protein
MNMLAPKTNRLGPKKTGDHDEGFTQIDLRALAEILREPLQEAIEAARSLPDLETAMAGLVRRIAPRQIGSRRPGPTRFDSPANNVGPWPASVGCTTNSYSSINPSSANASGSVTPPTKPQSSVPPIVGNGHDG